MSANQALFGPSAENSRRTRSGAELACGAAAFASPFGRDWSGVTAEGFMEALSAYIRWHREGRLKAFDEGGRTVYDTIAGRRRRLGLAA